MGDNKMHQQLQMALHKSHPIKRPFPRTGRGFPFGNKSPPRGPRGTLSPTEITVKPPRENTGVFAGFRAGGRGGIPQNQGTLGPGETPNPRGLNLSGGVF